MPPPAAPVDFTSLDYDPIGAAGIKRLPISAYSGKSLLLEGLGTGLGYDRNDKIDGETAATRLETFLDAAGKVDPMQLGHLPPDQALKLAKEKLATAQSQLYATIGKGPAAAGRDEDAVGRLTSQMFPNALPAPRTASFADVDKEEALMAAAMGLVRYLKGGTLGQGLETAMTPVRVAQGRINQESELAGRQQGVDAQRAQFLLRDLLQRQEAEQGRKDRQYNLEVAQRGQEVDDARKLYERLTVDAEKADDRETIKDMAAIYDSRLDPKQRRTAVANLYRRGRITFEEAQSLDAIAQQETVQNLKDQSVIDRNKAYTEFTNTRRQYLPKEWQVKFDTLGERRRHNQEQEKIARGRLGVAAEANQFRLYLGNQADATRNRAIDLRVPLVDATIAEKLARIAQGDMKAKAGLLKDYDARVKTLEDDAISIEREIRLTLQALAKKDVQRTDAEREALARYKRDVLDPALEDKLDEIEATKSERAILQNEFSVLPDPRGAGAGAVAGGAGGQKKTP